MTCVTRMILEVGRFLCSVKKYSSRKVHTTFDLGNSERRHLGSLLTPRPCRRSYLIGKLNYYYAPINVKPEGAGGSGNPREFDRDAYPQGGDFDLTSCI